MLDGIVRIDQLHAYSSYFRALAHAKHLIHPLRCDHLDIIVQKQQVFSLRMGCSEIVDGRIIEFFFPAEKVDLRILRQLFIILENLICCAVILYDDDLKILIVRMFFQRFQAGFQSLFLIFIGDDHRNKGLTLHRILHTIKAKILGMAHSSRCLRTLQMCFDGSFPCFEGVHLACRVICRGCLMCSPVIEDLRYMHHFSGFFCTAENKIIILGSVEFFSESAHLLHY